MSFRQVQETTNRNMRRTQTLGRLQSYRIYKGNQDLLLYFNKDKLESIAWSGIDGWRFMSVRLSPIRNLCTGELGFHVRLIWTTPLEDALIYVDGRKVEEDEWLGPYLEILEGKHEIRMVKDRHEIVKRIDWGPDDRGNPILNFSEEELQPIKGDNRDNFRLP